jgi:phosphatidate cytidylyltransferase
MVVGELMQRMLTACAILPVILVALLVSADLWILLMVSLAMLIALEWQNLSLSLPLWVKISGIPYIALALASAIMLRTEPFGVEYLIFVTACVVATDTAAYFGGKRFGKHALAPSISPKKTWEGLGCGVGAAALTGGMLSLMEGYPFTIIGGIILGILLALLGQTGDLLESAVKRRAGVKDSGTLLPGHGGLLDRLDGYLTTLPFFYAVVVWDSFYGIHSSAAL